MGFNGTAVVTQIKDNMVRVTGVSLSPVGEGQNGIGTVGLHGATGTAPNIRLPAAFKAVTYSYPTSPATLVTLQDSIRCDVTFVDNDQQTQPLAIAKTGTTEADFRVTLTNTGGSTTSGFEFYITFHD